METQTTPQFSRHAQALLHDIVQLVEIGMRLKWFIVCAMGFHTVAYTSEEVEAV